MGKKDPKDEEDDDKKSLDQSIHELEQELAQDAKDKEDDVQE